jgi:hypothetical protein
MFDSEKEGRRYWELKQLQKAGYISDLQLQVPFVLIPSQSKDGKVIERKMSYKADFVYKDKNGKQIVEDVKSEATKTDVYRCKKKLMLYIHGIEIQEY